MAHELTVYHHDQSFFRGDEEFPLESFPKTTVRVDEAEDLKSVLEGALREIHRGEDLDPFGLAAWLAFGDREQASVPKVWAHSSHYWGVTEDGRLIVADWGLEGLTIGDLRRGAESGYFEGAWDHIVVLEPEGLGGPGDFVSPFTEFFSNVGVDLAAGILIGPVLKIGRRLRQFQRNRRARRVIAGWHRQGLDGPWVLSEWIDRKTSWNAEEVGKRLGLTRQEAESLLEAVGYEYSARLQAWTVGTTEKAQRRRKRWDRGVATEWQRPRPR
jgi:hypothetical protein